MLEVKSLSKTYGKIKAADNVSFSMEKGEVVGFIGANGAGKSTVMNMLTGCLAPDAGDVSADGCLLSQNPEDYKRSIGYLPERPPLYNEFTVAEYLNIIFKMKKPPLSRREHVAEITEKFGLAEVKDRVIGNLSKGYRQRIGLAQAFLGSPRYVVLDEPSVGLDPLQKRQTLELVKKFGKNCAVLLSSHILSEISYACGRVIIIDSGRIVKQLDNTLQKRQTYAYKISGGEKKIISTLLSCKGVITAERRGCEYLVETEDNPLEAIFFALASERLPIVGIEPYGTDVEGEFIRLTGKR